MMSKIGLIIGREYSSRVRKRSFIVITILVPILIGALGLGAMWLSIQDSKQIKVLVADPGGLCGGKVYVGQGGEPPATFDFYEGEITLEQFESEERFKRYDLLLGIDPRVITKKAITGYYREKPSAKTEYWIRDKLELRLEEYFALDRGLSLTEYRRIRQAFDFKLANVTRNEEDIKEAQFVGFAFSIFTFVFILVYAGQVMRGVIEEKTSRVVEILVSSVKPFQLMIGKIVGIGLVGLTQFVIWIVLIAVSLVLMRNFIFQDIFDPANIADAMSPMQGTADGLLADQMEKVNRTSELITLIYERIPWLNLLFFFALYFIGGYLLYGSLFAMIGSAVDSETDTQQIMIPVMLPLIFSYIVSISILTNPAGPAAVWFSQIPFSSPIVMLQRIASNTVTLTEAIISLLILSLTFVLTTWAASKVYRTGILMYGKKASWREIFKWLRY